MIAMIEEATKMTIEEIERIGIAVKSEITTEGDTLFLFVLSNYMGNMTSCMNNNYSLI